MTIERRFILLLAVPLLGPVGLGAFTWLQLSEAEELSAAGIRVQVVEARSSVRERFRREGLDARLGGIDRFTSVADVVDSLQKAGSNPG